jgi:hypothetical protein
MFFNKILVHLTIFLPSGLYSKALPQGCPSHPKQQPKPSPVSIFLFKVFFLLTLTL